MHRAKLCAGNVSSLCTTSEEGSPQDNRDPLVAATHTHGVLLRGACVPPQCRPQALRPRGGDPAGGPGASSSPSPLSRGCDLGASAGVKESPKPGAGEQFLKVRATETWRKITTVWGDQEQMQVSARNPGTCSPAAAPGARRRCNWGGAQLPHAAGFMNSPEHPSTFSRKCAMRFLCWAWRVPCFHTGFSVGSHPGAWERHASESPITSPWCCRLDPASPQSLAHSGGAGVVGSCVRQD